MPEDRSPPEESGSDLRPSGKHKWRGKLFSPEYRFGRSAEDIESTDDDVASFLQHAATKTRTRPQPAQLTPRIDTTAAARFAKSSQPLEAAAIVDHYRGPRPRQNKGLHVNFVAAAPEIIGEGGDEAELPSKEVTKSRANTDHHAMAQTPGLPTSVNDTGGRRGRGPSPMPIDDFTFRPKPLQRAPTGLDEIDDAKDLSDSDQNFEVGSLDTSASPASNLKPLPVQTRDQQYDGSEPDPRSVRPVISPLSDEESDSDAGYPSPIEGNVSDGDSKYLGVPAPEILVGNSITPRPSPEARPADPDAQPPSYGFPTMSGWIHPPSEAQDAKRVREVQPGHEQLTAPKSKPFSLRQVAKGLGDDSLDDFDARVQRFNNIFRLGVTAHTDLMRVPFVQWIRATCWWFLMGRQGLESEVRNKSDTSTEPVPSPMLKQAYVNLAKAWWIVKEITPRHPDITRFGKASMNSLCAMIKSFGNRTLAELAEVHVQVVANMRALTMSMKRNGKLPPPDLEIQRLDLHVLLEFPRVPTGYAELMVNNSFEYYVDSKKNITEPFFPMLIGDTERHFNFGRMFVEVSMVLDNVKQNLRLPCVLSMLRDRREWGVQAVVASQDGQVNMIISDEMIGALPWKTVQWQIQSHEIFVTMSIGPATSTKLGIKFTEKDFKTLWGIYDYTQRIKKDISIRKDEELIFERTLRRFQCDDVTRFPADPIANCGLRVFEEKSALPDRPEQRTIHNGYRLTVITPPSMKSLSIVNYYLGRENPVLFGIHRGNDGSRLILRISPSSVKISPTFTKPEDIDMFRHLLSGTLVTKEDYCFPPLQLQNLAIMENGENGLSNLGKVDDGGSIAKLPWNKIRIIRRQPAVQGHDSMFAGSENLRILADSDFGTLTDRINLSAGELRLNLNIENFNEIRFLRPSRSDMTWSLADERTPKEALTSVCITLKTMLTSWTTRKYCFRSLQDLHSFQSIVTGFSVLYDGLAGSFAISRRRMVVPVHKKWEASSARLQVLRHDKNIQLVGFFEDFNHGSCINFTLKVTDVFEAFEKGEWFCLRIVDAKFPLPKKSDDESKDFVCLDMPDYASEHDDITIGFHNAHGNLSSNTAYSLPV